MEEVEQYCVASTDKLCVLRDQESQTQTSSGKILSIVNSCRCQFGFYLILYGTGNKSHLAEPVQQMHEIKVDQLG